MAEQLSFEPYQLSPLDHLMPLAYLPFLNVSRTETPSKGLALLEAAIFRHHTRRIFTSSNAQELISYDDLCDEKYVTVPFNVPLSGSNPVTRFQVNIVEGRLIFNISWSPSETTSRRSAQPSPETSSIGMCVDGRSILQPRLPMTYMGNAILGTKSTYSPPAVTGLAIDPRDQLWLPTLVDLAKHVKKVERATDDTCIRGILSYVNGCSDWGSPSNLSVDFLISNIPQFPLNSLYFGSALGESLDLKLPDPRREGMCWILLAGDPPSHTLGDSDNS
ncbi:hypothetical protein ASPWEDRAFT_177760 [Aspergillus wentii DTO 134E9]|uniref:Uncharacterized protein n=1 Tax=Aspergillus wentii DTO 134E9 TaxID=1073089 RepID=A0A1L9R537_ASPWE|nr:uncharacterized protein ASPWEDRAFT_177760 [Aspergillus wentii DTO 134E9]OJJ30029.1 hypothetical protein ASPWEDRAFT_177760 [Aspergillus wentii DTO 134E9]